MEHHEYIWDCIAPDWGRDLCKSAYECKFGLYYLGADRESGSWRGYYLCPHIRDGANQRALAKYCRRLESRRLRRDPTSEWNVLASDPTSEWDRHS